MVQLSGTNHQKKVILKNKDRGKKEGEEGRKELRFQVVSLIFNA